MLCEIPSFAKPIRCSGRAVLSWFINFPVSSCLTSSKFSAASREISNCLIFSPPACFIAPDEERLSSGKLLLVDTTVRTSSSLLVCCKQQRPGYYWFPIMRGASTAAVLSGHLGGFSL